MRFDHPADGTTEAGQLPTGRHTMPPSIPPTALEYKAGRSARVILSIHHDGVFEERDTAKRQGKDDTGEPLTTYSHGVVIGWSRAYVLTTDRKKRSSRLLVLEPEEGEEGELVYDEFFARGAFKIVEKVNNAKQAREAWSKIR